MRRGKKGKEEEGNVEKSLYTNNRTLPFSAPKLDLDQERRRGEKGKKEKGEKEEKRAVHHLFHLPVRSLLMLGRKKKKRGQR